MTPLLKYALDYARAGFRIIPLHSPIRHDEGVICSCLKASCLSIGKHPKGERRAAIKEASLDETTIRSWWDKWPTANVGMCTDGLAVIDIDPIHGGLKNWQEVCAGHDLPSSLQVITGSGGQHLFFWADGIPNSIDRIARGVDVRGSGGYVVAPPSMHASGNVYRWEGRIPDLGSVCTPLPEWLRTKCLTASSIERSSEYTGVEI